MDRVEVVLERIREGEQGGFSNTLCQTAYYISIRASSDKEAASKLKKINDTIHLCDEDGAEMLCKYEKYDIFEL